MLEIESRHGVGGGGKGVVVVFILVEDVQMVAFGISERKNDSKVQRQETDAPSASTTGQILASSNLGKLYGMVR